MIYAPYLWWESIWTMFHPYLTQSNRAGTLGQTGVEMVDFQLIHRLDARDSFPHHLSLEIAKSSVFESQQESFSWLIVEIPSNWIVFRNEQWKVLKLMLPWKGKCIGSQMVCQQACRCSFVQYFGYKIRVVTFSELVLKINYREPKYEPKQGWWMGAINCQTQAFYHRMEDCSCDKISYMSTIRWKLLLFT